MSDTLDQASATGVALTRDEAEDLLYQEARLLDERRFGEWLELMTDDIRYWIPSWLTESDTVTDVTKEVSLLYYDRSALVDYVARTQSGEAHIMEPPARSDRLVTNVLVTDPDAGVVRAKWLLHQFRRGTQDIFAGDCEYHLRREEGTLRIAVKTLRLSNSTLHHGYLPVV